MNRGSYAGSTDSDARIGNHKFSPVMIQERANLRTQGWEDIGQESSSEGFTSFASQLEANLKSFGMELNKRVQNVQKSIQFNKTVEEQGYVSKIFKNISGLVKKDIGQTFTNSVPEGTNLFGFDTSQPFSAYFLGGAGGYNQYINYNTTLGMYNAYSNVMPVSQGMDYIRKVCSSIPLQIKIQKEIIQDGKKSVEIENYVSGIPYLDQIFFVLHNPNASTQKNLSELISSMCFELLTTGNAFLMTSYYKLGERDKNGKSVNSENLPKFLRCLKTIEILQKGWTYNPADMAAVDYVPIYMFTPFGFSNVGGGIEFTPATTKDGALILTDDNKIRYLSYKDDMKYELSIVRSGTGNTSLSLPPLLPVVNQITTYYLCGLFEKTFFQNGGAPSYLMQIQPIEGFDFTTITDEQRTQLISQVQSSIQGARNAGRMIIQSNPFFKIIIDPITTNVQDMNLHEIRKSNQDVILQALGVPSAFFHERKFKDDDSTDRERFYEDVIFPIMNNIVQNLNSLLMSHPEAQKYGAVIEYDKNTIEQFKNSRGKRMLEQVDKVITTNEWRREMGMAEIGLEGDILYKPSNTIPVGANHILSATNEQEEFAEEMSGHMQSSKY